MGYGNVMFVPSTVADNALTLATIRCSPPFPVIVNAPVASSYR